MMTPRERVLTALDHRTPDRTPRDFWAEDPTWNRLFADVGHDDKARLLDDLGIDVRHLELDGPSEQHIGEGVYQNFWGERYIYRQTAWGPMREDTCGALADAQTMADLETFPWPTPDQFDHAIARHPMRTIRRLRDPVRFCRCLAASRLGSWLGGHVSGHGHAA